MSGWMQLLNTIGLIIVGILAYINRLEVKTLSVNVDGRLTQLLELTKVSSHAEGMKDAADGMGVGTSTAMPASAKEGLETASEGLKDAADAIAATKKGT